ASVKPQPSSEEKPGASIVQSAESPAVTVLGTLTCCVYHDLRKICQEGHSRNGVIIKSKEWSTDEEMRSKTPIEISTPDAEIAIAWLSVESRFLNVTRTWS